MPERYILTAKGGADGAVIEVTDGRVSHAPDVLSHWQGKAWSWCELAVKRYGWEAESMSEINVFSPMGVENWPY